MEGYVTLHYRTSDKSIPGQIIKEKATSRINIVDDFIVTWISTLKYLWLSWVRAYLGSRNVLKKKKNNINKIGVGRLDKKYSSDIILSIFTNLKNKFLVK